MTHERDMTPAVGTRGGPAWGRRDPHADVALTRPEFGDARWSYLYGNDTEYADAQPQPGEIAAANQRMRGNTMPADLRGPFLKPPVWTWEVPVYFWLGGIASGSAFVALAADLAGDPQAATVARRLSLAAVLPAPGLLISDLGRPARFLNMLRVFKPRSPMSLGVWCLTAFSATQAAAVAGDLVGRRRAAQSLGATSAVLGAYVGSYAGVLLAATAVPVWARSRLFLGPIFVSTATATGAAATRLALTATRRRSDATSVALGRLETAAILSELVLSTVNERRLRRGGIAVSTDRAKPLFSTAKRMVGAGLALSLLGRRPAARHVAGGLYLTAGLAFRLAWVEAGRASAQDDEAVALTARQSSPARGRISRAERRPVQTTLPARTWGRIVGRASLVIERLLRGVVKSARADVG